MAGRSRRRQKRKRKGVLTGRLFLLFLAAAAGLLFLISRFGDGKTEISLNGEEEIVLDYGKEPYSEPGASAVFRGSLFSSSVSLPVRIKGQPAPSAAPGVYHVVYSAAFHGRHEAEKTRTVIIRDVTPPELFLVGEPELELEEGEKYREEGCRASDDCDGNLSGLVLVDGSVEENTPGTYSLIYSVKDKAGNAASVTRTVTVKKKPAPVEPDPVKPDVTGPVIYLTFDDGPGALTGDILEILGKYGVKATFFVTNQFPAYQSMIAREAEEGHSVGIHTATHAKEIYADEEAFFRDMRIMQDIIVRQTGKETNILRFPFGSSNQTSSFNPGIMTRLTALVEERGFAYFDWNVSSGDGDPENTTEEIYNYVTSGIEKHDNAVVLMHDLNPNSLAAVENIIKWGLANGYTFLPLTHESPVCHHQVMN